jgi:hypothetical protein
VGYEREGSSTLSMIMIGHFQVHLLPLVSLVLVWIAAYQILALVVAQLSRGSLVAWNLGIFGINAIYLYKPHALVRLLQFIVPLVGAGIAAFWLVRVQTALISGVPDTKTTQLGIAVAETAVLGLPRWLGALAEMRYPLWGEARFIDRVARGQGNITFTAVGRAYIRQRFSATPEEFLRIVRRKSTTPLAPGTPLS